MRREFKSSKTTLQAVAEQKILSYFLFHVTVSFYNYSKNSVDLQLPECLQGGGGAGSGTAL
jgi:hypothetical protein